MSVWLVPNERVHHFAVIPLYFWNNAIFNFKCDYLKTYFFVLMFIFLSNHSI